MPRGVYKRPTTEEYFWEKVIKTATCWIWTAAVQKDGYGHFHVNRKGVVAHRYSYELVHGPIPEGFYLLHTCDVRACVNPAHLKPGTQADNIADAVAKGRHPHGESSGMAKYTTDQIIKVRELLAAGIKPPSIPALTGVKLTTVYDISYNRCWRHL